MSGLRSLGDPSKAPGLKAALGPDVFLDSGLPSVVFFLVYNFGGRDVQPAIWAALAAGVLLGAIRLLRRQPLQNVVAGFLGLALSAFIVSRTGRPEDIALPGLLISAAYLVAYVVSILVRWPLLGVLVGAVTGNLTEWRKDPAQVRAYSLASWLWVAMFGVRLAVQVPLYLQGSDQLGWLVTAKLVLGWPLFAVTLWLSWIVIRRALPVTAEQVELELTADDAADTARRTAPPA